MKRHLLIYIIFLIGSSFTLNCQYQNLIIESIDISRFPKMSAKIFVIDDNGKTYNGLAKANIKVFENNIQRNLTAEIQCFEKPLVPISSILSMDISYSMEEKIGQKRRLDIAKDVAKHWVRKLNLDPSESAILSFSNSANIDQGFTMDRNLLESAINRLQTQQKTNYRHAFVHPTAGSLEISKLAKNRKSIIFLTDGNPTYGDEPNVAEVINRATANPKDLIRIYCITIGDELTATGKSILENISKGTGGFWVEGVSNEINPDSIFINIFQKIRRIEQGEKPCEIEWISDIPCDSVLRIKIVAEIPSLNIYEEIEQEIILPANLVPKVSIKPLDNTDATLSTLYFEDSGTSKRVSVTSLNNRLDVDMVVITERPNAQANNFKISPSTFSLDKGESIELTIDYNSNSDNYSFAMFTLGKDLICPPNKFYASANRRIKPLDRTLKLLKPNGGEYLSLCSDTVISWEGVTADDIVKLELSTDGGTSWNVITENANNLEYRWKNLIGSGKNCLVRVSHKRDSVITIKHSSKVNCARFLKGDKYIVTGSDDGCFVWETDKGKFIDTLVKNLAIADIAVNIDGSFVVAAKSGMIFHFGQQLNLITNFNPARQIYSVDMSPLPSSSSGFPYIAVSYKNHDTVEIRDLKTSNIENKIYVNNNNQGILFTDFVFKSEFDKPDRILTIGADNKNIDSWKFENNNLTNEINGFSGAAGGGTNCVRFNRKLNKIFTAHEDGSIRTTNVTNFNEIKNTIIHNIHLSRINYFDEYVNENNDDLLVSGANDSVVSIFNASKQNVVKKLFGHSGRVVYSSFSNDGLMVVSASDDSTARIWDLEAQTLQFDVSDSVFSIESANVEVKDADIGKSRYNTSVSKYVNSVICNKGNIPLTINNVRIAGNNSDYFFIQSGLAKGTIIQPGACINAEFEYHPKGLGLHSTVIQVDFSENTDTLNCFASIKLSGECVEPRLMVEEEIDFSTVTVNIEEGCRDTILYKIKNVSEFNVSVSSVALKYTGSDFKIISSQTQFNINPFDSISIPIEFFPTIVGKKSNILVISNNSFEPRMMTTVYGEGLRAEAGMLCPDTIDFGTINCMTIPHDSVFLIKNILGGKCDTNVVISKFELEGTDFQGPYFPDGSAISDTITIAKLNEQGVLFKLINPLIGIKTGNLKIHSNTTLDTTIKDVLLIADVFCNAKIVMKVPDLTGRNGDIVEIPIILDKKGEMLLEKDVNIYTTLAFNATMLVPVKEEFKCQPIGEDGLCKIIVDDLILSNNSKEGDTLGTINCRATLGNNKYTHLELIDFGSENDLVFIEVINGSYDYLGICEDGDSSRYFYSENKVLSQSIPNPVIDESIIKFVADEDGYYELFITDILGTIRLNLISRTLEHGSYEVKLRSEDLNSGSYLCILRTPSRTFSMKLEVIR